ncbi:MAG: hypothetical protein LWX55_16005 [Deltaproteobacteria bacterium]|jgi:hypothetical protein|nr:hypothetical protein [Deltaproteobacteria bacterium]
MNSNIDSLNMLKETIIKLLAYCRQNNWSGYDPYDALNSRVFAALPFLQNRICRLVFTQVMKRSPVNLRPLFLVPKEQNPKGLALFASALLKLSNLGLVDGDAALPLLNRLIDLRSPEKPYYCWGYNFDWQTRTYLVPKYEPNIICTTFAGNALLDAYEKYGDNNYLQMVLSAGQFILKGLNITEHSDGICFSYTPLDRGQVHNANLLGAAFLARLYSITNEKQFFDYGLSGVRFSVSRQDDDGSWPYGEGHEQRWIDNFHTGYNLVALKKFSQYTGNGDFANNIHRGFQFFRQHFFTDDSLAKYYHDRIYPIDIHSIAQSIITMVELNELGKSNIDLSVSLFRWAIRHMQSKEGYFYYQKGKFIENRMSYMRWSQAWMLYALAILGSVPAQLG